MGKKRFFFYTFFTLIAGGAVLMILLNRLDEPVVPKQPLHRSIPVKGTSSAKSDIFVYFADQTGTYLAAEQRSVHYASDPSELGRNIINTLLKGPQKDLAPTIPGGTVLRAFYVDRNKTAYVDLSNAVQKNHPGGSRSELMTIYSVVNSLVLNIPSIERVKILIDGREAETLAGHIDLSLPFKADMLIIR